MHRRTAIDCCLSEIESDANKAGVWFNINQSKPRTFSLWNLERDKRKTRKGDGKKFLRILIRALDEHRIALELGCYKPLVLYYKSLGFRIKKTTTCRECRECCEFWMRRNPK